MPVQGVDEYLPGYPVEVLTIAAFTHPYSFVETNPIGRAIARTAEARGIRERFSQVERMVGCLLPVSGESAQISRDYLGSGVGNANLV